MTARGGQQDGPDPLVDRDCGLLDGNCKCHTIAECKHSRTREIVDEMTLNADGSTTTRFYDPRSGTSRIETVQSWRQRRVRANRELGIMVIYDPWSKAPYNKPWVMHPFDGCFGDRTSPASMCSWVVPGTWPEWML
jgi:hypothetical protein